MPGAGSWTKVRSKRAAEKGIPTGRLTQSDLEVSGHLDHCLLIEGIDLVDQLIAEESPQQSAPFGKFRQVIAQPWEGHG